MSLSTNGVLECVKEDSSEYCDKSKNIFFGISTNSWLFWVLITDSESLERGDLEYIEIF